MIVIYDIVLIPELRGEELEELRIQQVYTVPLLSISLGWGVFFSVIPVSVVKVLLKQSATIHYNNYLMPISL